MVFKAIGCSSPSQVFRDVTGGFFGDNPALCRLGFPKGEEDGIISGVVVGWNANVSVSLFVGPSEWDSFLKSVFGTVDVMSFGAAGTVERDCDRDAGFVIGFRAGKSEI